MLDLLNKTEAELPLDNAAKRARIESELQLDPSRSNRKIAELIGCDHKTVAAVRGKLPHVASPPMSPSGHEAEVDRALGILPGMILAEKQERAKRGFNPFDPDGDCIVARERPGLACFINTRDNIVICNGNQRDGIDEIVQVAPEDLSELIDVLKEIQANIRAEHQARLRELESVVVDE